MSQLYQVPSIKLFEKVVPLISSFSQGTKIREDTHVEVELQFGSTHKSATQETVFSSGIPYEEFKNLIEYYHLKNPVVYQDEIDTQTQIRRSIYPDGRTTYLVKKRLKESNKLNSEGSRLASQYGCRIAVSTEQVIAEPLSFSPTIIRSKKRYILPGPFYQLDITEVKNGLNTTYEVEAELFDLTSPSKINSLFETLFKIMKSSPQMFTTSLVYDVYDQIKRLLGVQEKYLNRSVLSEARDLTYQDLTFGELVGNPSLVYRVTHKTDGKRYMLAILPTGIWLLMPGSRVIHRVTKSSPQEVVNSLLDGELVPSSQMLITQNKIFDNYFYVFDCLVQLEEDLTKDLDKEHFFRMQAAVETTEALNAFLAEEFQGKTIYLDVLTKDFKQIFTVTSFYETMELMFLEQKDLPYENDGFIFTPANLPYYGTSSKRQIIKWKPKRLRTIDLAVINKQLYSFTIVRQELEYELFLGTPKYKLPPIEFPSVPNKTVVEFAMKNGVLTPYRIRTDKPLPNKLDIVESIWNNIFEGPDEETLLGRDFSLMRKYHNRIKKELLSSITQPLYLLDIGSGYGGDLSKWSRFDKIVAVEPDEEHLKELRKRLQSFPKLRSKIKIVQAGGEDVDMIQQEVQEFFGQKATCMSLMLSLSFFGTHEKQELLKQTIDQCVEVGGEIVFLTIDGDLVQQTFSPAFQPDIAVNELTLNNATLKYKDRTLEIDIPGTIVEKQTEQPPVLGDLLAVLNHCLVLDLQRADQEPFLNKGETILSNMYSYGALKLLNGPVSEVEVETVIPLDEELDLISLIVDEFTPLHGFLKSMDPLYQENNSLLYRKEKAKSLYELLNEIYDLSKSSIYEVLCQEFEVQIMVDQEIYGTQGPRIALQNINGLLNLVLKK
jgi:hypothetical protein